MLGVDPFMQGKNMSGFKHTLSNLLSERLIFNMGKK
jgi:hypothetical protein